jgi:hypothetical protein
MTINLNLIEITIFILLGLVVIYIIGGQFKVLERFVVAEDTTKEMNKQLELIQKLGSKSVKEQINDYVPHFDVINIYKNKTDEYLSRLKTEVQGSTEEKTEALGRLDNTLLRLSQYKGDEFLKQLQNADYKSLKSHNNGLGLSINRLGFNKYQVKANDGCVSVTPENDYNVVPCDVNDKGQHFELDHVFNETEYRSRMNKAFPQLSDLGGVHYPFSLVKSKVTDNCLKNSHNRLSVEPCREYEGQRWASSKTANTCNALF